MKRIIACLSLLTLTGCGTSPDDGIPAQQSEVFGARFKEGKGVELSDIMRESIRLETAEVTDTSLAGTNEQATVVPSSSILTTSTGTFVYVANGTHFLRTAITSGRSNGTQIEILDGLYAGDVVVKTPVNLLWYAELQAIRGGQACADEH